MSDSEPDYTPDSHSGPFNVVQFFEDGIYEYVRRNVSDVEAIRAAHFYTHNVASRMGITKRVIITDAGDCTCFEWVEGKVVFPKKEEM